MDLFEFSKQQPSKEEEKSATAKETILTVTEVTSEIKKLVSVHFQSKPTFWIKGEISGYKGRNQTGHMYFKLKDQDAILKCAFFKFANSKSKVELKEGLCVFARGKIDVYEKSGEYQLIIEELRAEGAGDLYLKFEQLKKKLQEEGLFLPEHKKPLPKFPRTIGVITSSTGAVIRDIIHVIRNRCPMVTILVFPVKVQGDGAADEIARAIEASHNSSRKIDVLIVGRGGGSIEDLWAFNEEKVARAIFASQIPIISAVGHQTDFTIADFVADMRAATPSHAAEMITPNMVELQAAIEQTMKHVVREVSFRKDFYREKLFRFQRSPMLVNPRNFVYQKLQRFDFAFETFGTLMGRYKQSTQERVAYLTERFHMRLKDGFKQERMLMEKLTSNLSLVNPLSVLSRGFSVVEKKNREIVREAGQVVVKEEVTVRLHKGTLECQILKN